MKEDIIRMLEEANGVRINSTGGRTFHYPDDLEEFVSIIRADWQEKCAKVCENRGERNRILSGLPNGDRDEFYCADDIRTMKDE